MTLLRISGLTISYGQNVVLDNISLSLRPGEILGVAGPSGCGKSTLALAILGLLGPQADVRAGEIIYRGCDLLRRGPDEMRRIRGRKIAMIFQEPLSALNPVFSLGYQISEMLVVCGGANKRDIRPRMRDLLKRVGLSDVDKVLRSYPHQLSGGQRQRVMIAMAICLNPELIIADEPTSNLDVTLEAQILNLFRHLNEDLGICLMLISHNRDVLRDLSDRVYSFANDSSHLCCAGNVDE
ncbi:MAG: ABC transporter ATP-binding protein [Candidatus Omnitrophota bacterium]